MRLAVRFFKAKNIIYSALYAIGIWLGKRRVLILKNGIGKFGGGVWEVAGQLFMRKKIFDRQPYITGYLAKQNGGNIPAGVERNRSASSVFMPVLFVRALLAHLDKSKVFED